MEGKSKRSPVMGEGEVEATIEANQSIGWRGRENKARGTVTFGKSSKQKWKVVIHVTCQSGGEDGEIVITFKNTKARKLSPKFQRRGGKRRAKGAKPPKAPTDARTRFDLKNGGNTYRVGIYAYPECKYAEETARVKSLGKCLASWMDNRAKQEAGKAPPLGGKRTAAQKAVLKLVRSKLKITRRGKTRQVEEDKRRPCGNTRKCSSRQESQGGSSR